MHVNTIALVKCQFNTISCQCHLKTHLSSYPWETILIIEIRPERINILP